jgi:hypothetical protein
MLLLSLLGCPPTDKAPETCPDTTSAHVAACFTSPTPADTASRTVSIDLSGTVAEVGTGLPEACDGARMGVEDGTSGWWARLTTDDGDAWVGIDTVGATAPAMGTLLTVRGSLEPADFGPSEGFVEVDDGDGLLAWVGVSGTAEGLVPPDGFAFSRGDAVCTVEDECGTWSHYDMDVVVDAATTVLPEASSTTVGGFTATVAAHQLSEGPTGCPDWFVASAVVGLGR